METTFHLCPAIVHELSVVFRELPEVRVSVDKVVYVPTLEAPKDRPYPFVYFITIDNQSNQAVTIRGRKWVISDDLGRKVVVEGDGVVGEHPRLRPGERFSYNSYHVIGTHSVAEGSFIGTTEDGQPFITRIPRFEMSIPDAPAS